jgi:hypothetical protein
MHLLHVLSCICDVPLYCCIMLHSVNLTLCHLYAASVDNYDNSSLQHPALILNVERTNGKIADTTSNIKLQNMKLNALNEYHM